MALLTMILCLLLVLSGYSDVVNPNTWVVPSFLGIAFGPLLVLAAVWVIVLLLTRRWHCLIALAVALVIVAVPGWRISPLHIAGEAGITQRDDSTAATRLSVFSYNTCIMGQAHLDNSSKSVPVLDEALASGADIVCLQEYSYSASKRGHTLATLQQLMRRVYPHSDFTPYHYNHRSGIALFSRYPITLADRIDHRKKGYIAAMYYQVKAPAGPIGIVNVHLQSNKFSKEDRLLYDEMLGHFEADSLQRIRHGLLRSLAVAWRLRANEADMIASYIHEHHPAEMPLLICGDFNDTPISYASYRLRSLGLSDTWAETGLGLGITYFEHRFWFRIDHILHSSHLRALSMRVRRDIQYSDHCPIEATFQILPQ